MKRMLTFSNSLALWALSSNVVAIPQVMQTLATASYILSTTTYTEPTVVPISVPVEISPGQFTRILTSATVVVTRTSTVIVSTWTGEVVRTSSEKVTGPTPKLTSSTQVPPSQVLFPTGTPTAIASAVPTTTETPTQLTGLTNELKTIIAIACAMAMLALIAGLFLYRYLKRKNSAKKRRSDIELASNLTPRSSQRRTNRGSNPYLGKDMEHIQQFQAGHQKEEPYNSRQGFDDTRGYLPSPDVSYRTERPGIAKLSVFQHMRKSISDFSVYMVKSQRAENARIERERLEQERLKLERFERERLERERLDQELLQQQRFELERLKHLDRERRYQQQQWEQQKQQEHNRISLNYGERGDIPSPLRLSKKNKAFSTISDYTDMDVNDTATIGGRFDFLQNLPRGNASLISARPLSSISEIHQEEIFSKESLPEQNLREDDVSREEILRNVGDLSTDYRRYTFHDNESESDEEKKQRARRQALERLEGLAPSRRQIKS